MLSSRLIIVRKLNMTMLIDKATRAIGTLSNRRADPETVKAVKIFLGRIAVAYSVSGAVLFGSRARGTFRPDSDADLAVLLPGAPAPDQRMDTALDMAGVAFDVLLETGILVEAFPIWEEEWENPSRFKNRALLANIRREGLRL